MVIANKVRLLKKQSEYAAMLLQCRKPRAFSVVLELVTSPLAIELTHQLQIPTIGIGSGENCDGQILVLSDVAGFFSWFRPKFAPCYGSVAGEIQYSAKRFIQEARKKLALQDLPKKR